MSKKSTFLLLCVLIAAAFIFTAVNVEPVSAYESLGDDCASCHDGVTAKKLGGSAPAPAEPKPAPAPAKETPAKETAKPAPAKSTPAKKAAPAVKTATIKINEQDVKGYLDNGTTLAPVRKISEFAKIAPEWDNAKKTVTIKTESATIVLTYGKSIATVNGEEVKLAAAVKIVNGVSYAPVRFLTDNLGLNLEVANGAVKVY